MAKVLFLSASAEDRAYILDSFLRSYGGSLYASQTHPDVLVNLMDPLLYLWNAFVVTDSERKMILGWIVAKDSKTVAWMYVRKAWRGKGIGRYMMNNIALQKGEIRMAFMPSQSCDFDLQRAWKNGYRLRFKPYLPLQEVSLTRREIDGSGGRAKDGSGS